MENAFKVNGFFLHASAVNMAGGACLFLGHSTAGKSTIARLLGKLHPVLADDSVYVARGPDGKWRGVDGSFRFGRDEWPGWPEEVRRRAAGGGAAPLRGCFRIHKAAAARVEPLAPLELARCLMDAAMEIDLQRKFGRPQEGQGAVAGTLSSVRQMRRQWFRWVGEIARVCPGGNLCFSMDSAGVELEGMLSSFLERKTGSA